MKPICKRAEHLGEGWPTQFSRGEVTGSFSLRRLCPGVGGSFKTHMHLDRAQMDRGNPDALA
jgi:hypothetical protein